MKLKIFQKSPYSFLESFSYNFRKNYIYYLIALFVVFLCELFFTIFALIKDIQYGTFDTTSIIYLLLYVTLGVFSLVLSIILLFRKDSFLKKEKTFTVVAIIYAIYFLIWSLGISLLDEYRHFVDSGLGIEYPVVFLTTLMAVAAFRLLPPIIFVSLAASFTVINLVFDYVLFSSLNFGFIANVLVFVLVAIIIAWSNHRALLREMSNHNQLVELSTIDNLTRVFNRRKLNEKVVEVINGDQEYTYVFADIDGFKQINDTLGHAFGDKCLTFIAAKLNEVFPDSVYRYGGDEFVVLTPLAREEVEAKLIPFANGLELEKAVVKMGYGLVTCSKGMSEEDVLSKADALLYKVKENRK